MTSSLGASVVLVFEKPESGGHSRSGLVGTEDQGQGDRLNLPLAISKTQTVEELARSHAPGLMDIL